MVSERPQRRRDYDDLEAKMRKGFEGESAQMEGLGKKTKERKFVAK